MIVFDCLEGKQSDGAEAIFDLYQTHSFLQKQNVSIVSDAFCSFLGEGRGSNCRWFSFEMGYAFGSELLIVDWCLKTFGGFGGHAGRCYRGNF